MKRLIAAAAPLAAAFALVAPAQAGTYDVNFCNSGPNVAWPEARTRSNAPTARSWSGAHSRGMSKSGMSKRRLIAVTGGAGGDAPGR